jgi:hypothetical protein
MLYGKIPRGIDIDGLLSDLRANKTKKEFIRNGLVYMIARIHEEQLKNENERFILLNHKTLERIIGKGDGDRVSLIKDILLSSNIIEVDGKYQSRHKSLGYKIAKDYLTEDVIKYPYGERISKIIKELLIEKNEWDEHEIELTDTDQYNNINTQFDKHQLTWCTSVYDDLKSIGHEVLQSFDRKRGLKNQYIISLLSYIGQLVRYINDIDNRNYHCSISPSNNRFNSVLTSTPKQLRPYLRINGDSLVEADITSSQPYLLSCILNDRFENEKQNGFNLTTLYPVLKEYFEISEKITQGVGLNNHRFFGCLFFDDDIPSIQEFCSIDFTNDFYEQVIEFGRENNIQTTREQVKKTMMNFLFNDKIEQRDSSTVIIILEMRFKGLMSFFEGFHGSFTSRRLALLLQKVESHLILDKVVPRILEYINEIPVFTIHDCVLTVPQYGQDVQRIMEETIHSITEKPLNVKLKVLEQNMGDFKELIVKNCRTHKIKNGQKVVIRRIKSNVMRGYNFLFPDGNEEIFQMIEQYEGL